MSAEFLNNYQCQGELLPIRVYPDPVLLKKSVLITSFDATLTTLAQNMLYTMYQAPGIGLAAPQVGKNIRLIVVDTEYHREKQVNADGEDRYHLSDFHPMVFVNPRIVDYDKSMTRCQEGCLSLPGVWEEVERYSKVTLEYQDLAGKKCQLDAEGTTAICIQHEMDHLDGIVFIDHLSLIKRNIIKKKLSKNHSRK